MMSMLCNYCVRELLILARTWFAFGLPSKTGCDIQPHSDDMSRVVNQLLKLFATFIGLSRLSRFGII